MPTRARRWLDQWLIEALICAELIVIANAFVIAGAVYALEWVARRFEHRASGRRVRQAVGRSPFPNQPNQSNQQRAR